MTDEHDEGWFTDPYERHQARWLSVGIPTKLVRDGNIESYDEPPDEDPGQIATKIVEDPPPGMDQFHRSDEAATEPLPTAGEFVGAAVFGALSTWRLNRHNRRNW